MTQRIAWITGARGFIGRHLSKDCAGRGWRVGGLGRGEWSVEDAALWGVAEWESNNVSAQSLDRLSAMTGPPNTIYHLAGGSSVGRSLTAPADDFRDTTLSTLELLEWVRTREVASRIVLASSAAVYGEHDGSPGPIREEASAHASSPYGAHKRAAEQLCEFYSLQYGICATSVRMFSVYGPWLRKQLLWDLCSRLSGSPEEIVLSGTGCESRDFLHVSDAVSLLRILGEEPHASASHAILNAGTGVGTAVAQVAHLVVKAFPSEATVRFSGETRRGDPSHLVGDATAARGLGWRPSVRLNDGIDEYVSWFREARLPAFA